MKMCIVENPHGLRYPSFAATSPDYKNWTECRFKIDKVSQKHEGTWKMLYAVTGATTPIEQKIHVKLIGRY